MSNTAEKGSFFHEHVEGVIFHRCYFMIFSITLAVTHCHDDRVFSVDVFEHSFSIATLIDSRF